MVLPNIILIMVRYKIEETANNFYISSEYINNYFFPHLNQDHKTIALVNCNDSDDCPISRMYFVSKQRNVNNLPFDTTSYNNVDRAATWFAPIGKCEKSYLYLVVSFCDSRAIQPKFLIPSSCFLESIWSNNKAR